MRSRPRRGARPRKPRPTPRQQRFVAEYLRDLNGAQAAIRAGYSGKRADSAAWEMLRHPAVALAVAEGTAQQLKQCAITATTVLERQRRIGFAEVADCFDLDGNLLPFQEWPQECRSALAGFEVIIKNAKAGDNQTDTIHKVRFWNKNQALDTLCRHLGLLQADVLPPGAAVAVPIYNLPAGARVGTK